MIIQEQEPKLNLPWWAWIFPVVFGPLGGIGAGIAFRKRKNSGWLIVVGFIVGAISWSIGQSLIPGPTATIPEIKPPESYTIYLPLQPFESEEYIDDKFSIRYPIGWTYEEDLVLWDTPIEVLFLGPYFTSEDMSIVVLVQIYQDPLVASTTLDSYVKLAEMEFKSQITYPYIEVSRTSGARIGGEPSILVTGDFTYEDGTIERDTTAYMIKDDTAYMITYAAPKAHYEDYFSKFTGMLGSFGV